MRQTTKEKVKKTTIFTLQVLVRIALLGGVLIVGTVAPNLPAALYRLFGGQRRFDRHRWRRTLWYLERRGYLVVKKEGKILKIALTRKGAERVSYWQAEQLVIPKPNRWDGKWRLVAFDIPEKRKLGRDVFRSSLKRLGFYKIQHSIFAHPYPCTDEIEYLVEIYEIAPYVIIGLAEALTGEYRLLRHFNLSKVAK